MPRMTMYGTRFSYATTATAELSMSSASARKVAHTHSRYSALSTKVGPATPLPPITICG